MFAPAARARVPEAGRAEMQMQPERVRAPVPRAAGQVLTIHQEEVQEDLEVQEVREVMTLLRLLREEPAAARAAHLNFPL